MGNRLSGRNRSSQRTSGDRGASMDDGELPDDDPLALGNLSDQNADEEPDLATIISFLLRSGQIRLLRSGGIGGFRVNVLSNSTGDLDFPDDDSLPSTPPEYTADTSRLDANQFKSVIEAASGGNLATNITGFLRERESGVRKGLLKPNFSLKDKAHLSDKYLPNRKEVKARFNHKVFCGEYSNDGDVFMSACQDQHIRLYDTSNGQFKLFKDVCARDVGWSVVDTAYSSGEGQYYLIYSSWSEFIHLCNIYGDHDTHIALDLRPEDSRFCAFSVMFSQDSNEILAGGSDRCLYIYDRIANKRTLRIEAHDDDVNAVCFSDDSSHIIFSGGDDSLTKVWDRRTLSEEDPKPVGVLAGHTDGITFIDSKRDGRYLISNSKDQSIKLWDMRRFACDAAIRECRKIASKQNWDYRWESVPRRSQRLKTVFGDPSIMTYRGHSVLHTLIRARFSPEFTTGQKYIYTGCATGAVVIYDSLTGNVVKRLKGHRHCVRDVSWHPYAANLISTSWDCTIARWEFDRQSCEDFESYEEKVEGRKRKRVRNIFD